MEARPRVKDHSVTVTAIRDITGWYKRITVDACGLFDLYDPAPGAYLFVSVPSLDGAGTVPRAYTLHGITQAAFSFEVVLHEPAGPGCRWAETAQPGSTVDVSEPPYHVRVPEVSHAIMVADTTAIPAIASFLEALDPAISVTAVIEDSHPDHDLVLPVTRENTRIVWVDDLTDSVLSEVATGVSPDGCFFWAGGERRIAKLAKAFARADFAVPRDNQHIQTYWIAQ